MTMLKGAVIGLLAGVGAYFGFVATATYFVFLPDVEWAPIIALGFGGSFAIVGAAVSLATEEG